MTDMYRQLRRSLGDWRAILLGRFSKTSYSQEGEDMILGRIFGERNSGFYVDVGAHHPIRFSNTYLFYRRGWRGLNVEPNPDAASRFRQIRRRDLTLSMGVAEHPGMLTYFCFDDPALNTFDESLSKRRVEETRYRIERTMQVKVERLDAILAAHLRPGTDIDFLSVDVEGLDLSVLRSNDWSRFRPHCVLAEALETSLERVSDTDTHRFMKQQGYEMFAKSFNTLFFLDQSR